MSIPADDRGLLLGDGLFETVLAKQGRLVLFEAHAERMIRGCAALSLPPPELEQLREAAEATLQGTLAKVRAAVRLTWTAGSGGRGLDRPFQAAPRLFASASPSSPQNGPVSLATVAVRRNDGSPASRLKSLAYLDNVLARNAARAAGAEEALMLNTKGEAACAAAANLFWIEEDKLFTPALDCGVLDGIMRAALIEHAATLDIPVVETHAAPERLAKAQAVFLTNSLICVRWVSSLDGRALPSHPLVETLAGHAFNL